ncbi:universal stress protein [Natronocalculus amylovorans]|uniref:Universal stress protein n=1 Tax=Natronocalculus amylovorans TaxID=2917812 RepID=A0AAE3FZT3_9EURY|nr:universal stress protein [Natronocalculus amylovorans]MCL9818407.1 universal stress protein [Natronocalculus amylovorans]NUE02498.1 universal stress protein [Halorubraceae archaeon YAN]
MSSRVLVAMDHSDMSEKALRYALSVHQDAKITVLHVVGEPSSMWGQAVSLALEDDIEQAARDRAKTVIETAEAIAAEYDTTIDTKVLVGHPARAIINHATNYDTVIIGSHGGTLAERLFVGNVAEQVFRRSPIPVTVVR